MLANRASTMATQTSARPSVPKSRPARGHASTRFDWAMAILSTVLVGGFYLDLWAHQHGRTDNTFFTPWHAMLYGAEGSLFAFLAVTAARNVRRGAPWRSSLPAGYGISLIGAVLFAVGGVLDLLWHLAFGIEVS